MQEAKYLTIFSNKKEIVLNVNTILYAIMKRNNVDIHVYGGKVYTVRMTLMELEEKLGEGFIMVHRSRLVSAMAIHEISDKIYLNNGETIEYVVRKKKTLRKELLEKYAQNFGPLTIDCTDM